MGDERTEKEMCDYNTIDIYNAYQVIFWTKCLGVSKEDLMKAIGKVGPIA